MKKKLFFISISLFIFLVVASCTTKEINLITNIDFELLTDYESNGFVKDSLVTTVTLIPERTNYPGFSYFVNYKVLEGDGYFIANDSTRLPQETDILLYHEEDFAANWHYIGTKQGEHKIAIIARDNYEKEKSTTLSYELKPVNLLWEATSPQTMAQVNDTIPFRLVLENRSLGSELTYSQLIKITAGEGLILNGDKQPVILDKSLVVTEGTLDWYYVGATIGQNRLQFDLAISNDDEKFTELIFDIKEELKNEAPVAVADIAETFATKPIEIAVLENDSDPENDQLTITAVTVPVNGTAVIEGSKIIYTPNTAFVGNEPFAYTIMDAAGNEVSANITVTVKVRELLAIPDPNFEQALIDLKLDDVIDQKMFRDVAQEVTVLDVSDKSITDLTGIEGFLNLVDLSATDNKLTSVDITQNKNLKRLTFKKNKLTALDLSQNLELEFLELWFNEISLIDVSQNVALEFLDIDSNNLSTIVLTDNINLTELFLFNNILTTVDISKNKKLKWLQIGNRTGLPNDNAIITLNLKGLSLLTNIQMNNMPSLSCVEVDDVNSEVIKKWTKDETAYYSEDCSQPRATIAIPDANFEQALINLKLDDVMDQKIFRDVAEGVTSLDVSQVNAAVAENKKIKSLEGVEGFINLTTLEAKYNALTAVDLSQNLFLDKVDFESNRLRTIDVTNNKALTWLSVFRNQLTALSVSQNADLVYLDADDNNLSTIDLSKNLKLEVFGANENKLTALDLRVNTKLKSLSLGYRKPTINVNMIASIDVTQLPELEVFSVNYIQSLENIDLTKNTKLLSVFIKESGITSLDLSNSPLVRNIDAKNCSSLIEINIKNGSNDLLKKFEVTGSSNVTCIEVDDRQVANTNVDWKKDATAYYSEDCSQPRATITIPDANFEKALFDLGHDMTLGDNKIFKDIAEGITSLNVNNKNISSLEGIEGFTALETLRANDNNIRAINLSQNKLLKTLSLEKNQLSLIDVSNQTILTSLDLENNRLTALDISQNTSLILLQAGYNQITIIDLTNNLLLRTVGLFINQLTVVDISQNSEISFLDLTGNNLSTIDVTKNLKLRSFGLGDNMLSNIDLSKNSELAQLEIFNNQITSVNFRVNTNLQGIRIDGNQLSTLNVTSLISLTKLWTQRNSTLNCIQVADVASANAQADWKKDATASYNTTCP